MRPAMTAQLATGTAIGAIAASRHAASFFNAALISASRR